MEQTDAAESEEEMVELASKAKDRLESVWMNTDRKSRGTHTEMKIKLVDEETNALEQLMDLINMLVLEATGMERI